MTDKDPNSYFEKLVKVVSSDPTKDDYLVRLEISAVYCQCKGFAYRQTCRHLNAALVSTFGAAAVIEGKP